MNKVKSWSDCEIGDAVLVPDAENSRTLFVRAMEGYMRCGKCYYGMNELLCPVVPFGKDKVALCDTHHSCRQVYFESGAGNIIPKDDGVGNDV